MDEMDAVEETPQTLAALQAEVSGLHKVVIDLQSVIKDQLPMTTRRRAIGWLILGVLVASLVGLLVVQRLDVAAQQRTSLAQCEAVNDHLRDQRTLYQSLIVAEQLIPPTTPTNISIRQARIAAYTQMINTIRLTDCERLYG